MLYYGYSITKRDKRSKKDRAVFRVLSGVAAAAGDTAAGLALQVVRRSHKRSSPPAVAAAGSRRKKIMLQALTGGGFFSPADDLGRLPAAGCALLLVVAGCCRSPADLPALLISSGVPVHVLPLFWRRFLLSGGLYLEDLHPLPLHLLKICA